MRQFGTTGSDGFVSGPDREEQERNDGQQRRQDTQRSGQEDADPEALRGEHRVRCVRIWAAVAPRRSWSRPREAARPAADEPARTSAPAHARVVEAATPAAPQPRPQQRPMAARVSPRTVAAEPAPAAIQSAAAPAAAQPAAASAAIQPAAASAAASGRRRPARPFRRRDGSPSPRFDGSAGIREVIEAKQRAEDEARRRRSRKNAAESRKPPRLPAALPKRPKVEPVEAPAEENLHPRLPKSPPSAPLAPLPAVRAKHVPRLPGLQRPAPHLRHCRLPAAARALTKKTKIAARRVAHPAVAESPSLLPPRFRPARRPKTNAAAAS
jgi:hypothetical protein